MGQPGHIRRRASWIAAPIALVLIALPGCAVFDAIQDDGDTQATPTPQPGTVLDPPQVIEDFTLTSHTGEPFSLSALRGQVVLLYFGYIFCPDVCPLTLLELKRAKDLLGDEADRVEVVFISVDSERDTPERLAIYLSVFDPEFIGLTGDDAAVRDVARRFGAFYQRRTYDNTEIAYLVDHTASTFVIGPAGQLRIIYPFNTDPGIIAVGVRSLLRGE